MLGILFDDIISVILISTGFAVFETNPVYVYFGMFGFIFIAILIYSALSYFWISTWKQYYSGKYKGDFLLYMMCMAIVFMSFTKISLGASYLLSLNDYNSEDELKSKMDNIARETEHIENISPEIFKSSKVKIYTDEVFHSLSLLQLVVSSLGGYALLRMGVNVKPKNC